MKVTPAHDHDDYEVGKRHRLPNLTVIDESGKMTNVPAEFQVNLGCQFSVQFQI